MNRERFIRQRKSEWQDFENLLGKMKAQRMSKWSGRQITRLSSQYRSICYDLSLVQSREWGARLEQYLNDLVAQGHNCLYRSPPRSLDSALFFLSDGFPALLRSRQNFFWVSLALFAIPLLVALTVAAVDPVLAEHLVDRQVMESAAQSYSRDFYKQMDSQYAEERNYMAGFYVWNNVGIAFRCFARGALFGIGTVVTLLFNGMTLGAITGYVVHQGVADNFFSFTISHAAFELTAIVVAGAAGLLVGWGMIHPGEYSRMQSLRLHGLDAIRLGTGAGFMLGVAALIEAYFSPSTLPHSAKYFVGALLWILVFCYLRFGGRGTYEMATRIVDANSSRIPTSSDRSEVVS